MIINLKYTALCFLLLGCTAQGMAQPAQLDRYNLVWESQSKNSGESMPVGGGDIGMNVWVENGDVLFYMSRSGAFDEHNTLLKQGRVRLKLSPNPFEGSAPFRQELMLRDGYVEITGGSGRMATQIKLWADVFNPLIRMEVSSKTPLKAVASYESWRFQDKVTKGKENNANSWKWAPKGDVRLIQDSIRFNQNAVLFYHRNRDTTVFDAVVRQQGMNPVKDKLYNPLRNLTSGGLFWGSNMKPAGTYTGKYQDTDYKGWRLESVKASRQHQISVALHIAKAEQQSEWQKKLMKIVNVSQSQTAKAFERSKKWWNEYWQTSFVFVNPGKNDPNNEAWQTGRNYQLFRYMLGANAYGDYPTKFNGGLFTYDPAHTDSTLRFTPDYRNWGGGTHTAQNQRLVYWPMLKSGDWELMKPQFDFYTRIQRNAELRSEFYWNHKGASFTEQLENFGLPNPAEYNWKRPADYDKGMEYNAWLEYEWDTVLEFCMMMMETERYAGKDISSYIPFIESCLTFFDEHYQYLAKQRGSKTFDQNGHLVLYPGSATETYKMAYNASSTIAALKSVLGRLLELPSGYLSDEKRKTWETMLNRIPPITFMEFDGKPTIAPAKLWERVNNTESPQLYPVYPWGIYGIDKPGLDTAINTFLYDKDVLKFRSHVGWKQDNIFAARLGLTKYATELTTLKLKDSGRRFPAFWGPGFDWTPDHNWGGSGMIGMQEMLMQVDDKKIYLFPAWDTSRDVHFKLHAPYSTTVEAVLQNGKLQTLKVLPESRKKDVVICLD